MFMCTYLAAAPSPVTWDAQPEMYLFRIMHAAASSAAALHTFSGILTVACVRRYETRCWQSQSSMVLRFAPRVR